MMREIEGEGEITILLRQWCAGQREASDELLRHTYARLRQVAAGCMRRERQNHTLQPTALVSELYLRLASGTQAGWNNREHFYSFCARAMRWILADHARSRRRDCLGLELQIPLSADMPWLGTDDRDIQDLELALQKLEVIEPRIVRVLELRIYLGSTAVETATILKISKATVDRDLTLARAWLFRELRLTGTGK